MTGKPVRHRVESMDNWDRDKTGFRDHYDIPRPRVLQDGSTVFTE
jgi:hypothetical protein